jgi:uncharacterized protein (TIGR00156 family)
MKKGKTMKTKCISVGIATLLAASSAAQAQYTGPSTVQSYQTVAQVNANPVDDMPVVLEGFIVKKVGKEKYIFTDGTGEIRIDLDDKYLPAQPFDDKTKVQLRGEVEKDFLESPEIDVEFPLVLVK